MKKFLQIAIIIFALIAVFAFAWSVQVNAGKTHKISGWAWSENSGWLSMNCFNSEVNSCATADYGVDYDLKTGDVSGWAWSEYGGWVCFGKTCAANGFATSPDGLATTAKINTNGLISGWGMWLGLGADGWIKLQGAASAAPVGSKYMCGNCTSLKTDVVPTKTCGYCFTSADSNGSGKICTVCNGCTGTTCAGCTTCYNYGLAVDYSENRINGWAWNGDKANVGVGYGWLKFHPSQSKTVASPPFVETVSGDVYSGDGVGDLTQGAAPAGSYNAMFLVQTNGEIINFNSRCANTPTCGSQTVWTDETTAPVADIPQKSNEYSGTMARFDLKGIFAGQYGPVTTITSDAQITVPLAGKISYSAGDLTLNAKTLTNSAVSSKGSGTILVKGDLYINGNIDYSGLASAKVKNLASFGVIVLKKADGLGGNIYIAPGVEKLAGAYFAEGTIYTGTTVGQTDKPLEVKGLFAASEIRLERNYRDLSNNLPAERVIYDGRVLSNTPPGFADVAKALPVWE
jgi:hypothetical protein